MQATIQTSCCKWMQGSRQDAAPVFVRDDNIDHSRLSPRICIKAVTLCQTGLAGASFCSSSFVRHLVFFLGVRSKLSSLARSSAQVKEGGEERRGTYESILGKVPARVSAKRDDGSAGIERVPLRFDLVVRRLWRDGLRVRCCTGFTLVVAVVVTGARGLVGLGFDRLGP